jgi:ATP-binding cassette subfamily F protein 3
VDALGESVTQLSLSSVGVCYGPAEVLKGVSFTVTAGDRWGVVGRNGSGKTSLFRIIMGEQEPSVGQVARAPALRIAVLDQHRDFLGATTVWEAVAAAFRETIDLELALARQADEFARAGAETTEAQLASYARDLERFDHLGGYRYISLVDEVLEGLGFPAEQARTQLLASLSGGERGRVGLARQLVVPADVLLLDEPTNHLDLETTHWLEEYLRTSRETQMIISHDRAFLDRVVDHILHVEDTTTTAYACGYADFVTQRAERRLAKRRAFERQDRVIAREEDYIRRNIAGQNTRQAKGRRKRLTRLPRLTPPPDDESAMSIRFDVAERGGDQVIVFERAVVGVGERMLLSEFTERVRRRDVIGLIGPNGTGKTMLLRALLGARSLRAGSIRLGGGITPAVYTQDFADVPRDRAIYETIADLRPAWERGQVMGHLGRVQFSGDEVKRLTSSLSGGELARIALAMMMLTRANLLIFDEPTNHLDVESIEALEDAIERYDGTVVLVSHDRELLRKLVTRVWELRDGSMRVFDGSFAEWEDRSDAEVARTRAEAAARSGQARSRVERTTTAPSASRLTSQLRRDLERAEAQVAELEERQRVLNEALADTSLYGGNVDRGRVADLTSQLSLVEADLRRAIAQWENATYSLEAVLQQGPHRREGKP